MHYTTASYILLLIVVLQPQCFAHPGRTDSSGGHNNRKSGGYHYHRSPPVRSNVIPKTKYKNSSSRTRARTSARTTYRSKSRKTPRTSIKTDDKWKYFLWKKSETSPALNDGRYTFYEYSHKKEANFHTVKFIVKYSKLGKNTLVSRPPKSSSLKAHLLSLRYSKGDIHYYLNGMSVREQPWAKVTISSMTIRLQLRSVLKVELKSKNVSKEKRPLRTWSASNDKYQIKSLSQNLSEAEDSPSEGEV